MIKTPQLSDEQIEQLTNLIDETILGALCDDGICEPDMSDLNEEDPNYDNVWEERANALHAQAIKFIKNNL